MEKIGGRKFFFALLLIVMSFVMVIMGKMEVDSWATFASIVGGTYVVGNVASKIV